jgi:polar amino acid transport system ATP-binding protein
VPIGTHAIRFARQVAHSVHVLGEGRVIESGLPEQVLDHPRDEATRLMLAEAQAA